MSTPGAIAVYDVSGPPPSHVGARSWRGVYHHRAGEPGDLGNELLDRLRMADGDLDRFVYETITAAADAHESPITQNDPSAVAFVYVLDILARRLDVFATHVDGKGALIASASIAEDGQTEPRFFDLTDDERRAGEDVVAGAHPPASAAELDRLFSSVLPIESPRYEIVAVSSRIDEAGAMLVTYQVLGYDEARVLREVVEREIYLAMPGDERDVARLESFLGAWADAMREVLPRTTAEPEVVSALAFGRNALRRTTTRDRARFYELTRAALVV